MNTNSIAAYLGIVRLFNRDVRLYLVAAAILGFSYFGFVAVLLNLYLLRLGYGPEFIGLANAMPAIAFAVSSVPSGLAGGRWGYRRLAVVGMGLIGIANIFLPLAEMMPSTAQEYSILATRLISGLGFSLFMVNANPYLVAATNPQERNHAFSMQVALLPLTGFFGSLIAGIAPGVVASMLNLTLDHPAPYRYPLMFCGMLLIPAAYVLSRTREIKPEPRPSKSTINATSLPVMLITFLALTTLFRMMGEGAARSFFNVYLDVGLGVSTARIGVLTAMGQILAGPAAMAAPLLVMRTGKVSAVVLATMGMAVGLLLLALVPHWIGAGLGLMAVIGMLSITRAVMNVVQMEIVEPSHRSSMSGITSMAMGMGFSSMTLSGGYIITAIGFRNLYLIGAGMVIFSGLIFWSYFRIPRGEYARQEAVV